MAYNIVGALNEMRDIAEQRFRCKKHPDASVSREGVCSECEKAKKNPDEKKDESAEEFLGSFISEMTGASNDNNRDDPLLQIQGYGGLLRSQIIRHLVEDVSRLSDKFDEMQNLQESSPVDLEEMQGIASTADHILDLLVVKVRAIKDNSIHYTQQPGYVEPEDE